jgi:hypothetical protein
MAVMGIYPNSYCNKTSKFVKKGKALGGDFGLINQPQKEDLFLEVTCHYTPLSPNSKKLTI